MDIYERMHMPQVAKIGKTVFKKMFYENVMMSHADENLFSQVVDKIVWQYCLKWENCNIQPYSDEEKEYSEVEVMEVVLREQRKVERLAELVLRGIPYPMILLFRYKDEYQLWLATYTRSQADVSKNVISQLETTDWLNEEATLWQQLALHRLRTTNFYDTYRDLYDIVSCLRMTALIGHEVHVSGEMARSVRAEIVALDEQLYKLRGKLKKASQFSVKVELNMQIKKLRQNKKRILQKLK